MAVGSGGTWGYYTGYESSHSSDAGEANSVHILVGFFFALNYMLGYGFLAVPYAVHHTGLAVGWVFILSISAMCCLTAWWTLEVMARAQALEYWRNTRNPTRYLDPAQTSNYDSPAISDGEGPSPASSIRLKSPVPVYEIDNTRKFELTELCELFLGSTGKVLYIFVLSLQLLVSCWLYITVAVTSWSINIPWNISASAHVCEPEEFHDVILPTRTECRTTYRFYVFCFALIIVPLSCIDFRKQKFFQVFTTMFRFMAVLLMTSHAIYYFIQEEVQAAKVGNFSTAFNESSFPAVHITDSKAVLIHDGTKWLLCIPVMVYAQTLHQAIPALCHVVKKQYSYKQLFTWVFVATSLLYCVYGTTVAFVFSHKTLENSALNWIPFTNSDNLAESIIAYIIVIFPSIDVCSVFPLVTVTLGNNLYSVMVGRDTSVTELDQGETDNKRKILYRVLISLTSVILAVFMANLLEIVKVCGIFSFLIVFIFPALLQYKSRRKCKRVFGRGDRLTEHAYTIRGWHTDATHKGFSPRLNDRSCQREKDTPYSSIFSFSLCSILIGCLGLMMLGVTGITLIMKKTDVW